MLRRSYSSWKDWGLCYKGEGQCWWGQGEWV